MIIESSSLSFLIKGKREEVKSILSLKFSAQLIRRRLRIDTSEKSKGKKLIDGILSVMLSG